MDTAQGQAYAGGMAEDQSERVRRAALADLERLRRDGDALGGSFARLFGRGDPPGDPIELWGRRIGRTFGVLALIGLSIYLYAAYLR